MNITLWSVMDHPKWEHLRPTHSLPALWKMVSNQHPLTEVIFPRGTPWTPYSCSPQTYKFNVHSMRWTPTSGHTHWPQTNLIEIAQFLNYDRFELLQLLRVRLLILPLHLQLLQMLSRWTTSNSCASSTASIPVPARFSAVFKDAVSLCPRPRSQWETVRWSVVIHFQTEFAVFRLLICSMQIVQSMLIEFEKVKSTLIPSKWTRFKMVVVLCSWRYLLIIDTRNYLRITIVDHCYNLIEKFFPMNRGRRRNYINCSEIMIWFEIFWNTRHSVGR